jgi:hypothetical protein
MKTNAYLYGEDTEVPEIDSYIVSRRIELLKDNLDELLEVHHLKRDGKRVNTILSAIRFWESINREN